MKDLDAGEAIKKPQNERTKLLSSSTLTNYRPIVTFKGTFNDLDRLKTSLEPIRSNFNLNILQPELRDDGTL